MEPINKLGEKIRQVRTMRNVTVSELAERSGIAETVIDQIENGELVPSLSPLIRLARTLGVRLGTFLDDLEEIGPVVTRKGEQTKVVRVSDKADRHVSDLDFFSLAHGKAGRHMEPFMIEIAASSASNVKPSSHEGEEFIYVLSGIVEVLYGKDRFTLETGDSIYYDSIVAHHVHAAGGQAARILAVVYAPF